MNLKLSCRALLMLLPLTSFGIQPPVLFLRRACRGAFDHRTLASWNRAPPSRQSSTS